MDESTEDKSNISPPPPLPQQSSSLSVVDSNILEKVKPLGGDTAVEWMDHAVQQALVAQRSMKETLESAISVIKSRLDQIKSTSTAHLGMTLDTLQDLKSEYNVYEDIMFGKIKEGVFFAAAHPLAASTVVAGSGLLVFKRPRRSLYYSTMRLFVSEETMLAKANSKVQKLQESIKEFTETRKNLEKFTSEAEEEMKRGRKKLRQAGKQIQGVVNSAYKIERQAGGLKDILKELPNRNASVFRSKASQLASEAKRERRILSKEVRKISDYGISV